MPETIIDRSGDPNHPTILLVGVGDAELTARLVAGTRHVLRHPGPLPEIDFGAYADAVHLVVGTSDADAASELAKAQPDRIRGHFGSLPPGGPARPTGRPARRVRPGRSDLHSSGIADIRSENRRYQRRPVRRSRWNSHSRRHGAG